MSEQAEPRSTDEYKAEIDTWENDCRKAWPKMLRKLAATVVPAMTVQVSNLSETYLENVKCTIHLEGPVIGSAKRTGRLRSARELPDPPRKWGPIQRNFAAVPPYVPSLASSAFSPPDVLSHRNGGSVDLSFTIDNLPPEEEYQTPADEKVLLIPFGHAPVDDLHGRWKITARGHHQSYRGELSVAVERRGDLDFTSTIRANLAPKAK